MTDISEVFKTCLSWHRNIGREYCFLAGFFFFFFLWDWLSELFLISVCPLGTYPVPVGCLLLPALVSGWPGELRTMMESKVEEGLAGRLIS